MSNLTWIIMGAVVVGIIGLLGVIYFTFQFFMSGGKLKKLPKRMPKNKRKRQRLITMKSKLVTRRKRALVSAVLLLFLTLGCGSGAAYATYYQSINLSSDDQALIVRSYFLLRDFQNELNRAANQEDDASATQQNVRYLATSLAAYSTKKASTLNTSDGQSTLNRYYASLTELGTNATRESNNFYGNATLVESFQSDIEKAIGYETSAFEFFKINQATFESEGLSDGE